MYLFKEKGAIGKSRIVLKISIWVSHTPWAWKLWSVFWQYKHPVWNWVSNSKPPIVLVGLSKYELEYDFRIWTMCDWCSACMGSRKKKHIVTEAKLPLLSSTIRISSKGYWACTKETSIFDTLLHKRCFNLKNQVTGCYSRVCTFWSLVSKFNC